MSNPIRITGMASGLDVDSIVKQLMTVANVPLDKIKQDKQITQWKQDNYRDTLGDINTLKSTYFDVLKTDTNMLSSNSYAGFDVTNIDSTAPTATPGVIATAISGATAGGYSIVTNQLAKPSTITGDSINLNKSRTVTLANWDNQSIGFSISNGTAVKINLSASHVDISALKDDINAQITADANLKGQVVAVVDGSTIRFDAITNNSIKITNDANTTVLTDLNDLKGRVINPSSSTILSDIGMSASTSFNIKYNGTTKSITFDNTKSIDEAISAVALATSGGVIAKFSQLTGSFTFQSSNTGSGASVSIDATIPTLGMNTLTGTGQKDAIVQITPPGGSSTTITKSTNNFTVDGVSYNLLKEGTTTNINISSNTQKTFDKIKTFIDKYNEMIGKISSKLSEKKQKGFPPLTDDQRKAMTPDQIKVWEDKAKQGLLRNDSNLQNMITTMRTAFYSSVQGAGISLSSVGLSTSADYTQGGKIIIDETKLKAAIQNNGSQVANLFMKQSNTQPSYSADLSTTQRTTRSNEEGIFQRINDVFQDYTTTLRNSNGKKGLLVEQAGIKGDFTEFNNLLSQQLKDKDKVINDLTKKLHDKETAYYTKFSKLETAMQKLNSQSSWLSQQTSKM